MKLLANGKTLINSGKELIDPTSGSQNNLNLPVQLLNRIITYFLIPALSVLAVASLVYGGVLYITAGADTEKAAKGKSVIIYSVIGILLIALSYLIYEFIRTVVV